MIEELAVHKSLFPGMLLELDSLSSGTRESGLSPAVDR